MTHPRRLGGWFAISLCALASASCGGGSNAPDASGPNLTASWVLTSDGGGTDYTRTVTLAADGSAIDTVALTMLATFPCTGTITYVGLTWTSTSGTVTFSGTPACTSTLECTPPGGSPGPIACADNPEGTAPSAQMCDYGIANADTSLAFTGCSYFAGSYTRQR